MNAVKSHILIASLALVLSSCINWGNEYHTHTEVFDDGSIERTVTIHSRDSLMLKANNFGATGKSGWLVRVSIDTSFNRHDTISDNNTDHSFFKFTKRFNSVEESNLELSSANDTLYRIKADFEKRFRWFYTDLKYSDTYLATLRFKDTSPDDYFTEDDYTFIDGYSTKNSTKEDSLRSIAIQKKEDEYLVEGIFGVIYQNTIAILKAKSIEGRWLDTLETNKQYLKNSLMESDFEAGRLFSILTDSLKIPVEFNRDDSVSYKNLEKWKFSLFDSYTHSIQMPANVTETNADSVSGSFVYWNPEGKFLYKDYVMYAELRIVNYWTVTITGIILIATGFIWVRKRKKAPLTEEGL